jgi:hypothetical protein
MGVLLHRSYVQTAHLKTIPKAASTADLGLMQWPLKLAIAKMLQVRSTGVKPQRGKDCVS